MAQHEPENWEELVMDMNLRAALNAVMHKVFLTGHILTISKHAG